MRASELRLGLPVVFLVVAVLLLAVTLSNQDLWTVVVIPLLLIGSVGVVRAIRRMRRQDALLNLQCPNCGFDIRGQLAAALDKCPECGCALKLGRWIAK